MHQINHQQTLVEGRAGNDDMISQAELAFERAVGDAFIKVIHRGLFVRVIVCLSPRAGSVGT